MASDSLISASKIRRPIKVMGDIESAFDSISYGKGGAVIAMFEAWIGEDKFRTAMRNYMRKHAWKTATSTDFLAALAEVSEAEIPAAFSTFLDQAGVPLVSVELSCKPYAKASVSLTQQRFIPTGSKGSTDQMWQLPVCLEFPAGNKSYRHCELLKEKKTQIQVGAKCPKWVLANADSVGYYRANYEGDLLGRLLSKGVKLSTAEKIGVIQDQAALLDTGKVSYGDALGLIPVLLRDDNHHIITAATRIATAADPMVPDKLRGNYARFLRKMFGKRARKLGWKPRKGEADHEKLLRQRLVGLIAADGQDKVLSKQAHALGQKWLSDPKSISADLTGTVLAVAAHNGDVRFYDQLRDKLTKLEDRTMRRAVVNALGSFQSPALVDRNFELMLSSDLDFREAFMLLGPPFENPALRQKAYDFVKANYETIAKKLPPMARSFLVMTALPFCDKSHLEDAEKFFTTRLAKVPGGPRAMTQMKERMELCIAQRVTQQPAVESFLRKF
jgi:alanyl aminopeptidase